MIRGQYMHSNKKLGRIHFDEEGRTMLNKISNHLATKLLEKVDDVKYDKSVYVYGFELTISTMAGLASILLSSVILSNLMSGVIFIAFFVPLRLYTGGYHASTYAKCFIVSNLTYILLLILKELTWGKVGIEVWFVLLLLAGYYISQNAPQINVHHNIKKKEKNNRIAKIILIFEAVGIIFLSLIRQEIVCIAVLSICLVAVFMLLADNQNKKGVMEI